MEDALGEFLKKKKDRADKWRGIIMGMLGSDSYNYAQYTLLSILDYVEDNGNITDGQIKAVENIKSKPTGYGR